MPKNHRGRIEPVELQLQGYDCFHNMGQDNGRRGIAMRVKKSLGAQPVKLDSKNQTAQESVWCEISLRSKDSLLVGTVYRSPNSTRENDVLVNELIGQNVSGQVSYLSGWRLQPSSAEVG